MAAPFTPRSSTQKKKRGNFAHADDITAAPITHRGSMQKKNRGNCSSLSALSRLILSLLLERHGVLLLVPLVYFSGMLLFMRNGSDLSHIASTPSSPPLPPTLHDLSIFDIPPYSPSPAPPPTEGSYISELDFLRLRDVTNSTDLVFVLHLQANESGYGRGLRL